MGTLRTNCLDCLDRTNAVQSFIALQVSDPFDIVHEHLFVTAHVMGIMRKGYILSLLL